MHKTVSLLAVPWQGKSRAEYLALLEKAILELPLLPQTIKVLSIELPEGVLENELKSLLYQMLDKGVRYSADKEPGDWSNDYSVWNEDVALGITGRYSINTQDIERAFEDVNDHLDGFYFAFNTLAHAWLFTYVSPSYQKHFSEQMKELFDRN